MINLVRRLKDNQCYALKQIKNFPKLTDKARLNAIDEVRILASISHPSIIGFREAFYDTKSQSLCLVMQYADAGDLLGKIMERKKQKTFFRES